ncbi:anti-sigma factor [Streptomyces sp. NPDC002057]|uniref:anti-sigma factor n=1 Tax=Streptomyces sp. NPDC002057 TaxID=3154664 RepID=UPI00331C6D01
MNRQHADVHALAAPYSLNALDPTERTTFRSHLRRCADCLQEVADFQATAARLAAAAAQAPPAAMKQRTVSAVSGVRQLPPRVAAPLSTKRLGALRRRAGPLALAAGLAAAASFAGLSWWQNQESEQSVQRARQAEQRLDAISTVLAAPDARTVHGRTTHGALTTVVASGHRDKAVFTATGLPTPAAGMTYQVWLEHRGTMRPGGLIHGDGSILITGNPGTATAIGLTLEPVEGSARPTTAPLLRMPLPA